MTVVVNESQRVICDRVFTGSLYAGLPHGDGRPYHTFRTASVLVTGRDLTFRRCRFENTALPPAAAGAARQAIALYLDGDEIRLEDCVIRSRQDSLFLAPLPEKEREKDGFLGPRQYEPRLPRTVHLTRCRIEGDVDFVFGGATAYFDECEFVSLGRGWVFAPCTPPGETGFVARGCRFTAAGEVPEASCYVARPWREHAAVTLEDCTLGPHIHPQIFCGWNEETWPETVRFEIYH